MSKRTSDFLLRFLKTIALPFIVYLIFMILSHGKTCSVDSIMTILQQAIITTTMACGMVFTFRIGLWDFSVGAVVTLAAIVGGALTVKNNFGLIGLIVFCIITALICSTLTGTVFALLKIPSIIVSIGMLLIYETLSSTMFDAAGATIPPSMRNITVLAKTPQIFIVGLIAIVLASIIYDHTQFGCHIKAIGSNANIAQRCGINVLQVRFWGFSISGLFLGIAAILEISLNGSMKPVVNMSTMSLAFDAIIALFLGMYLSKFCGLIIGVLVGGITMRIIASGLLTLGLISSLQDIVKGAMMILFISLASTQNGMTDAVRKLKNKIKQKKLNVNDLNG